MSDSTGRLGDAVRSRRAELGISQVELWKAGGPSNSTLTNIESGRELPIHPKTLRKLDFALGWPPGNAYRVLHERGDAEIGRTTAGQGPAGAPSVGGVPEQWGALLLHDAEQARRALERYANRHMDFEALAARVHRLIDTAEQSVRDAGTH